MHASGACNLYVLDMYSLYVLHVLSVLTLNHSGWADMGPASEDRLPRRQANDCRRVAFSTCKG